MNGAFDEEYRLEQENITLCIRLAEYEAVSQHEFIIGLTRDEVVWLIQDLTQHREGYISARYEPSDDAIARRLFIAKFNDLLKGDANEEHSHKP